MGCKTLDTDFFNFLEVVHRKKATEKFILGLSDGYVEPNNSNDYSQGFKYAYQYKDIWENTRVTYSDTDNDGIIDPSTEIISEKNYYPYGMTHSGYNNVVSANVNEVASKIKTYQGQEFTDDLGLNTHEWKYRVSDPTIGRFWQIDPLAEDYVYNSTYAFQENKMGMGVELEGLELGEFPINGEGIARAFESKVNQISEFLGLDRVSFVAEGSGKVNLGLALGAKIKEGGLIDVNAGINAFSFEVASGNVDLTDPFNPDSYTGELGFDENGNMPVSSGINLSVKEKVFDTFGLGGSLSGETVTHELFGPDIENAKNTSNFSLGVELYNAGRSGDSNIHDTMNPKSTVGTKTDENTTCYCLNLGAKVQVLLGVDLNLKIGFEYEH